MARPDLQLLEDTFQTVDELARSTDAQTALRKVSAWLARFGFSAFVLTRLPSPAVARGPQILLDGWPEGWTKRYEDAGHYAHDPVARYCMGSDQAFRWRDIPEPYWGGRAREVAGEAAAFQLNDGFCVPLHTPLGAGGFSLSGALVEVVPGLGQLASVLAHSVCEVMERIELASPGGRRLTNRERDILAWVAYGKTAAGIAEALSISEHTVGEHLKHIRFKLGTSNNAHSIVRAMQLGQLRL